jgi:hypothetical protein
MSCTGKSLLRSWASAGSDEPKSAALLEHVARCEVCAVEVRRIERVRRLGGSLPAVTLTPNQQREMKFALMAETRRCAPAVRPSRAAWLSGPLAPRRVAMVGALVVSTCIAAVLLPNSLRNVTTPSKPILANRCAEEKASLPSRSAMPAPVGHEVRPVEGHPGERSDVGVVAGVDGRGGLRNVEAASGARPPMAPVASAIRGKSAEEASGDASAPAKMDPDDAFAAAWSALRNHRAAEAARGFDRLLESSELDASRRADVLYWSAQAHRGIGDVSVAERRCRELLEGSPRSPFAPNAALVLGELEQRKGNAVEARRYFERALSSSHANVRERAKKALASLEHGSRSGSTSTPHE